MLHLRTVLQRCAALLLTLSAVCGVVLWDKGYYDIAFIPRRTQQPGESGEDTRRPAQSGTGSSDSGENSGTHPIKPDDFRFADAEELRSRGAVLYTGKYDAGICTAAQVRLSGNLTGIGIFSAETLSVSRTVRVQTAGQGIQLETQTSPWSLPAIFPYMGYLFTFDGTRRGLYSADGTLLREDMPKVGFPYCRDGEGRPVVESEGAYYAVGEDGTLTPVELKKDGTGLYFDYPSYYGAELDRSLVLYSETKRVFYRLPADAVTDKQKYTEKQKELIEGGMTPEEALAWRETESSGTETEEPATEPITEPVTDPATEPITEPVTEPVTEPTSEPETDSGEQSPDPSVDPDAEPDAEKIPGTFAARAAFGAALPAFAVMTEAEGMGSGVADVPGNDFEDADPEIPGTDPVETVPEISDTDPVETAPEISGTDPVETDPEIPDTDPIETDPVTPDTDPVETEPEIPDTDPSDTDEPQPPTPPAKEQYYTTSVETLWGYRDTDGNVVLEAQYFFAHPFNQNGLAAVGVYSEKLETVVLVFIDRQGSVKIDVAGQQISRADRDYRPMYNGYYASASNDADSIGSYYFDDGYVRVRRVMVDCRKIWNASYTKTLYSASYDEDILIDSSGKEFSIPDGYTLCAYSDGILLLKKDGYYGYMNNAGKWIAQPIYTYAEPFQQGLGVIGYADGVRGVLDTDGGLVIPFEYTYISSCSYGVMTAYSAEQGWSLFNLLTLPAEGA